MLRFVCFLGLILMSWTGAAAQQTPKAEIFGGYSYFRFNPASNRVDAFSLHGWNTSVAGNVNDWLGLVADFSGQYGTPSRFSVALDIKTHSFLFGPRVSYRKTEKFTPFAHALFGATRVSGRALGVSDNQTGFATALGGGVDVKATSRIAVRLFQADYQLTRLKGEAIVCLADPLLPPCPAPQTESQHNVRLSFGVVFRLGMK